MCLSTPIGPYIYLDEAGKLMRLEGTDRIRVTVKLNPVGCLKVGCATIHPAAVEKIIKKYKKQKKLQKQNDPRTTTTVHPG